MGTLGDSRKSQNGVKGPEDRFHSFKRVLGAKRSQTPTPQLSASQAECVWGFLFYPVFVAVAIALNPIIHQAGWGNQKIFKEEKRQRRRKRLVMLGQAVNSLLLAGSSLAV